MIRNELLFKGDICVLFSYAISHTYFIFLSFGYYHVLDINCDYGIIIGVYYSNPVYTELFVLPMQQCLLHCIKSGLCSSCKESRT